MTSSVLSRLPSTIGGPKSPRSRRVSGNPENDTLSNGGMSHSYYSRRMSSKRFSRGETTNISEVVSSLKHRSGDELGPAVSSQLLGASESSVLEWIRGQRMTLLPPEGSDYDKVLAWAQLFVERLHSFDLAIEDFAGDSYLAAQLAYGYCFMLLELGRENATALTTSFGFFYSITMALHNLLERTELFNVNHEIRDQLVLALGDLVTLVANVSIYFHKAINGLSNSSVSVDLYGTFPDQIQTFRQRCEKVSASMWRHQLLKESLEGGRVSEVASFRSWLSPDDRVVAGVADSASHLAHEREELTCLWMGPYLARCLKSQLKTFAIVGKPGSGKTVLSSVVVDHLQHPIGGISYDALYIPINARIPVGSTLRAVASNILSQLLARRIGNIQLFQILSDAYKRSRLITSEEEHDNLLWVTLESALGASLQGTKDLILVVDGIDESICGERILAQKLASAVSKASNVKLITFGVEKPAATEQQTWMYIDKELVFDDISAVVRSYLQAKSVFSELDEMDQETIVSRVTDASDGSFVWAKLAIKRVRGESTADGLRKAVDTLLASKPTISDFVLQALHISETTSEAKQMLLWLATAERPLQLKELAALASVQVDKLGISDKEIDVLHILKPLKSLIFLQDDLMYLRHGVIRTAVLEAFTKGKLIPSIKDHHVDLVTRLLVYIRNTKFEQREPSLTALSWHDANNLINKYPLLEFALRYWPLHLAKTSAFQKDGPTGASKYFSKSFPTSISVVQLQNTIWEALPSATLFAYSNIALNVYREILTPNSVVTLQSTIFLAQLLRQLNRVPESVALFYQAATTSYTLLTTRNIITMQMLRTFLDLTVDQVNASKTNTVVQRIQVLVLIIECYKVHYGTTSESVVTALKTLSEHYRLVKNMQKAQEIEIQIKDLTQTHGDVSNGNLAVKLQARQDTVDGESSQTLVLDTEYDEKLQLATHLEFEGSLQLAQKYTSEGHHDWAERLYVEIWQRATDESRTSATALSEERKMKAALDYSRFLHSQERGHEAGFILSSLWQDAQQSTVQSDTGMTYLQEVAKVLKTVGFSTLALAIFKRCSDYYSSTNNTQSSSYKDLQQSIQVTSQEVMQSMSSSSSFASVSMLEEMVYEATQSINSIDQVSLSATDNLIQLYVTQHRWRDATRLIKRVLHGIWPSLFTPSLEDVSLPAKHADHCVSIAKRLCQCYRARRRSAKEEDMHVRIYRAVRCGRNVEDTLRQHVTLELLHFYETTSQTDVIINTHQELLKDEIEHYGPEHAVVLKQLWTLAGLTRPRPVFIDYYQQIIQILNKGSKTCHPDAFEPVIIVAAELWIHGRYSDAVNHYRLLFTDFLEKDKPSSKLKDPDFVQEIFVRYTHCLRAVRTDFTTLYSVTTAYQTKCKIVFGVSASISVQATLTLAKLCQESKRYESHATALYEELLKTKSDVLNREEISGILDSFYEEQAAIASSSSSQGIVSADQVQQAVKIVKKRISTVRQTYGWAHEESLSQMRSMISLYSKHGETNAAVSELNEATTHILSSTTSTTALASAAATIASSYIALGHTQKANELTDEVYRQVILKDTGNAKKLQFDLSSKSHQSLIFLAQLKHSLRRSTSSVTEILASLTAELVYFEDFRKQIGSQNCSLYSISLSASRLYRFLLESGRHETADHVLADLKNYFIANEGKRVHCTDAEQVHELLWTILDHLNSFQTQDLTRSIGIAGNKRVIELLKEGKFDAANHLAIGCYKYISAQESYSSPEVVKFVFMLGMNISGRGHITRPKEVTQKKLLSTSSVIIRDTLCVVRELKLNIALLGLENLNSLIGLLGEHQDRESLAWLLTILWNSREVHRTWQPDIVLALARRFVLARYLAGDTTVAVRLAEDVVYNCRRVHGIRHSSTLDMSILLSQLYTGVALKYQAHKDGAELAKRYYKKSASTHENILRGLHDQGLNDLENHIDSTMSLDGNSLDLDFGDNRIVDAGEHVGLHFKLFKLAVERLGDWPKDYAEYDRLNADLFREFPDKLKGFEGVEKWNLKSFGGGKAESNEDLLNVQVTNWQLFETQPTYVVNGV